MSNPGFISLSSEGNGVFKVESFSIKQPLSLKTVDEVLSDPSIQIPRQKKKKNLAFCCRGINPRFKEYLVVISNIKQFEEMVEKAKTESIEQKKYVYVSVLRLLNQYTDAELNAHYESCSKEWDDWCADVSIFYAYNNALFNRAAPVIILDDEQLKTTHKYQK
jgi:hypothetical protein